MYRSFVTCNDPGGVVECGTIRKSKTNSDKMERKIGRQRNSGKSFAFKAEEEEVRSKRVLEYCDNQSGQILEVSKGARKLNQMVDSWSKGRSYENRPKDIAKGLLKGALDLQESLVMLGRLQEATQYTACFEKTEMEKFESGRNDGERASFRRFRDHGGKLELQKPRHSVDGSRDAIEELKKAIRDGFARQNLDSNRRNQGRSSLDWRQMESASDIPSTSSSQSSVIQSSSSYSSDSYVFRPTPEKKANGINVVAKLMGLDDIPSKPSPRTLHNQSDVEKNSSQRKPNFDIEKPAVWKAQPTAKMVDSKERTLKEVLETMHFKGLLRSNSARELKSRSDHSTDSYARRRSVDNVLPIVVMKPQRDDGLPSEEPLEPCPWIGGSCDMKMALRKMMVKEMLAPTLKQYKEQILSGKKFQQRAAAEITVIKKFVQEEESKDQLKRVDKKAEKDVKTVVQKERLVDSTDTHKKMQAEDTAKREIVKTKSKGPPKTKSPVHNQEQRKETSGKRLLRPEKIRVSGRETAESKTLRDQDKVTSFTKLNNPEKGSTIVKIQSKQKNAPKTDSKHRTQANIRDKEKKKKEKPGSQSVAVELTGKNLGSKEDDKCFDMVDCNESVPLPNEPTAEMAEPVSPEEKAIILYQLEDHSREDQTLPCNDTAITLEYKNTRFSGEGDDRIDQVRKDTTVFKSKNPLKALLLNSSSFTARAEEFFHLDSSSSNILPTKDVSDSEATDMKLLLDYANELIEIRSLPATQTRHPLLPTYMKTLRTISIDQIADEVCNGVASLASYADLAQSKLPADWLYATMERDIMSRAAVSGIWGSGWRGGFSVEEAEEAVKEVEKLVVSDLIEEVFTEGLE